jgi:hypothetical protein
MLQAHEQLPRRRRSRCRYPMSTTDSVRCGTSRPNVLAGIDFAGVVLWRGAAGRDFGGGVRECLLGPDRNFEGVPGPVGVDALRSACGRISGAIVARCAWRPSEVWMTASPVCRALKVSGGRGTLGLAVSCLGRTTVRRARRSGWWTAITPGLPSDVPASRGCRATSVRGRRSRRTCR